MSKSRKETLVELLSKDLAEGLLKIPIAASHHPLFDMVPTRRAAEEWTYHRWPLTGVDPGFEREWKRECLGTFVEEVKGIAAYPDNPFSPPNDYPSSSTSKPRKIPPRYDCDRMTLAEAMETSATAKAKPYRPWKFIPGYSEEGGY